MTASQSIAAVTETGLIAAPEPNLDVLLGCAATGDGGAFMRVYDLTADCVYGLALRLLEKRADAEDVAAAAYQEIWSRSAFFDSTRHSAAAWIVATAHRHIVTQLRARAEQEQRRLSHATHVRHVQGRPALSMVRGALRHRPHERTGYWPQAEPPRAALAVVPTAPRMALFLASRDGHAPTRDAARGGAPTETAILRMIVGPTQHREI